MSGRYWVAGAWSTATANFTLTTNTVVYIPFVIHRPVTIDRISINIPATSTTTAVRIGIYSANLSNGQPDALILDAGTLTTTTVSVQELTVSQALSKGTYYFAIAASGAPILTGVTSTALSANWNGVAAVGTTWQGSYRVPFTYAALTNPATTGTKTYITTTPLVYYRIV